MKRRSFGPTMRRARPFRLIGFDTEDADGEIIQACFYGDDGALERCYHVDDVGSSAAVRRQAMRFLLEECRSRTEVRVAAINLEYDVMNLSWPEYFGPDTWDVLLVRGRWIYARLVGTNVSFMDLGNHIPQSAKRWGDMIGRPKLEFAPRDPVYCLRDAEIAYGGAAFMRDLYVREGGDMRYTAPASALDIYRRRFMRRSFEPVDEDRLAFYRSAYYGGRTEVFRWGRVARPLEHCDVKSMYPSLMRRDLPDPDTFHETRSIPDSLPYVADVDVVAPEMHIPVLPTRIDEKLIFPVGRFRGVFCRPEIDRALEVGYRIARVHRVVAFANAEPFLADYVGEFYPKKRAAEMAGDRGLERFYKTGLLNSLYGKFGSAGRVEKLAWRDSYRTVYDFLESDLDPPVYANVIWSAYITAYGRALMHKALCAIDDAVYCDTDGLVMVSGVRAAIDVPCERAIAYGDDLGSWAFEGHYDRGEFWRPKAYSMTGHEASGSAVKIVHVRGVAFDFADEILEKAYVEFTAPLRMREAIRRGYRPNVWIAKRKRLDREYDKRVVLSGGRTEPIRLP